MQDQHARSRGVVQARPGQLDLLQLAENLCAKGVNGALVAGLGRVHSKLTVDLSTHKQGSSWWPWPSGLLRPAPRISARVTSVTTRSPLCASLAPRLPSRDLFQRRRAIAAPPPTSTRSATRPRAPVTARSGLVKAAWTTISANNRGKISIRLLVFHKPWGTDWLVQKLLDDGARLELIENSGSRVLYQAVFEERPGTDANEPPSAE